MAFNPFHHFRRYSKTVFAVLAIICMFTFVLSSGTMGRGDFFTEITDWVTNRRRIPPLMTLYGKEYDARQVYQVQVSRPPAKRFVFRRLHPKPGRHPRLPALAACGRRLGDQAGR